PDSGQLLLDFTTAALAQRAAPMARRQAAAARAVEDQLDAEQWFELGLELEAAAPEEARDAYRRALELEPLHLDARLNLGRLLQVGGRAEEAAAHYRAILEDHPAHATAWFNLGVALEDLGRTREAIKAYQEAIAADRKLADAWYNLARLAVASGKRASALRYLSRYKLLTEGR
ncbi:MAG TPA: tetratricopeptide repeat protein, partial [Gemmatimonadales bacterium]|nr:tetratricopeptide repeat protein [Gemmatimonadales bacterium]